MYTNTHRRGAQGKHAAGVEQSMAQQVMDLFQVDAVLELPVMNYHHLPEWEKQLICNTLMDITLCKIPARDGSGTLYFYLRKESRV